MSLIPTELRQAADFLDQPPPPVIPPPKIPLSALLRGAADEIERTQAPFRAVDAQDWDYIMGELGHGGRAQFWKAQFWKAVLTEMRAALTPPQRTKP